MSDRVPAPRPCGSCPYRRDVPSGLWHPEEYAKLATYDAETGQQPPNLFGCHSQNGRLCAGWVGCHDMEENLALRLAMISGELTDEEAGAIRDYVSPVPLFDSGTAAAVHGLRDITQPSARAERAIAKLESKLNRSA